MAAPARTPATWDDEEPHVPAPIEEIREIVRRCNEDERAWNAQRTSQNCEVRFPVVVVVQVGSLGLDAFSLN